MALQIWTRDLTPELMQAQSNQSYNAIAGAGANIGKALADLADEHKRTNQQAKAVESFFGAMSDEDRANLGLPADMTAFKNLSAQDKIAAGTGIFQKQAYDRARQDLAYSAERAAALKAAAANEAKQPAFLSVLGQLRAPQLEAPPVGQEGPANQVPGLPFEQALGEASKRTGYALPNTALGRLLDQGGADKQTFFTGKPGALIPVTDETGAQVPNEYLQATGPNTSQPFRKEANPGQVNSYYDPVSGNSFYRTGGKNSRWVHLPNAKEFSPDELAAMHAEFKTASDPFAIQMENAALPKEQRMTSAQRIEAVAKKWSGRRAAAPPPSGQAASSPAAQQFNKGDRVRQNGVIYEFDGKNWNPTQ
jgi:hypothetical protein